MDFLADQEARSNHRLAELQRQQTALIQQQNAAQYCEQPLPGRAPARRRVLPVASPFKRQETDAAGPAATEDQLQQRERRQVLSPGTGACHTLSLHGESCTSARTLI